MADVHDASSTLAQGETKNAKYITSLCEAAMAKMDPTTFDLVLFDGASVVQTAGVCLSILNPRMTVIHGVEHVCALFCSDLLTKTKIGDLVKIYRTLYKYFGSGSVHMTYSQFRKHSCIENINKHIGLIQAAGTRMGGYVYAFYRLLRLRRALKLTILADEWNSVTLKNKKAKNQLEQIIEDDDFFDLVKMVVLILYPVIMCLRLADTNKPGMEKIWYFTRLTTLRIKNFASEFNSCLDDEFFETNISNELEDTHDNDSANDTDISDDEVSEDEDGKKFGEETFGEQITALWEIRERQLKTSYSICGWLLSVDP